MDDWQFENAHYYEYGDGAYFINRCEHCGSFVAKPEIIQINPEFGNVHPEPHTECHRCGPTRMIFVGYL